MVFQTPMYNITSTDIFTTIDTRIVESFSDVFTIEISNDELYGGCGSFSCSTLHLNEGTVQLLYNTGINYVHVLVYLHQSLISFKNINIKVELLVSLISYSKKFIMIRRLFSP